MKDLLLFARSPQPRRASVDLVPLVTLTADLLCQDPALKDIQVGVAGAAPPVLADAEMLKIGSRTSWSTARTRCWGEGGIDVAISAVDSTSQVSVTDTGPGIPADIRERVLHRVLHHQVEGIGKFRACHRQAAHRGASGGRSPGGECPPAGGTYRDGPTAVRWSGEFFGSREKFPTSVVGADEIRRNLAFDTRRLRCKRVFVRPCAACPHPCQKPRFSLLTLTKLGFGGR